MEITSLQKNIVYRKTWGCCKYCKIKLQFEEMVITHKVPLSRGGTDETDNLIPTCARCNELKGTMTHIEFRRKIQNLRNRHKKKIKKITWKQTILDKTGGFCFYCGTELTLESVTVDHIIPILYGGGNDLDNLVPACVSCNNLKGVMSLDEYVIQTQICPWYLRQAHKTYSKTPVE